MEYLVSLNLDILNQGNKPTFVVRNMKKVTDLTLATNKIGGLKKPTLNITLQPFSEVKYLGLTLGKGLT
jgi:hypothetical protein